MCDNTLTLYAPRGYDMRPYKVKCGNTDYNGNRAICDKCRNNPDEMRWIRQQEANLEADNAWARSAGWGEF